MILVEVELDELRARQRLVELARLERFVKAPARLAPGCAHVHQHAHAARVGFLDMLLHELFERGLRLRAMRQLGLGVTPGREWRGRLLDGSVLVTSRAAGAEREDPQ